MLSAEDRLELICLPGRYGNALDERDWDVLREIFIEDAVFEIVPYNITLLGIDRIVEFMDRAEGHPLAHLMMNIAIIEKVHSTHVRFRAIFPMDYDGERDLARSVRFGCYYDEAVKIGGSWRIKARSFSRAPRDMRPTMADLKKKSDLAQLFLKERAAG